MRNRRWLSFVSPLVLIAVWELAIRTHLLNPLFFPSPAGIIIALQKLSASGELWSAIGISLVRILLGFLVGAVPAIGLGLLMGVNPTARALLNPIASAINPIPKIILIPFIVFLLHFSESARVVSLAFGIFFMMLLDVSAAVTRIDPKYFEVARGFGAKRWDMFLTVALPASLPSILNTIKMGLAYTLTLVIGVEILSGVNDGIGYMTWNAAQLIQLDVLGAGIVIFAVLGWTFSLAVDAITPMIIPWSPHPILAAAEETMFGRALRVWWRAARPWSFSATLIPVSLGAIMAAYGGHFDLWLFALTFIGAVAIHTGTNLINDYYDYRKGADTEKSLGVGGAIQTGKLTPRQVFIGGIAAFALGSVIGLYLVSVTGLFILALGVFSVLAGFFYTAGPAAFAYIGLGEVIVFIFMGPVMVIGSYYVQAQSLNWQLVLASLPVGLLVAAILHANNLRDLESDRKIGKRTLATILGRQRAKLEYYLLIGGTYAALLLIVVLRLAPWYTLAAVATLPAAVALMRRVSANSDPAALNPVLRKTAQLHMRFGMLLVAGWVVALLVNQVAGR